MLVWQILFKIFHHDQQKTVEICNQKIVWRTQVETIEQSWGHQFSELDIKLHTKMLAKDGPNRLLYVCWKKNQNFINLMKYFSMIWAIWETGNL